MQKLFENSYCLLQVFILPAFLLVFILEKTLSPLFTLDNMNIISGSKNFLNEDEGLRKVYPSSLGPQSISVLYFSAQFEAMKELPDV